MKSEFVHFPTQPRVPEATHLLAPQPQVPATGWGLGALGWTGLVLSETIQNPARLVYGSAALVASLRGQQSHFATLPKNVTTAESREMRTKLLRPWPF